MMHQIPSGCIVESVGAQACEVLWGRGRIESVAECGCKDVREGGVCCSEDVRVTEVSVCVRMHVRKREESVGCEDVWEGEVCGAVKKQGKEYKASRSRVWSGEGVRGERVKGKGERGCYLIGFLVKTYFVSPSGNMIQGVDTNGLLS